MLSELLSLKPGIIVALVGAGGKTTTMYRLAAELAAQGQRVITTTTTHIFPPTPEQTDVLIIEPDRATLLSKARTALETYQRLTLAATPAAEGKLRGFPPEWITDLSHFSGVGALLVEADGAKGRLIKAPANHEPVIPQSADLVLALASASALGQPLSDAIAHRPERVAFLTGLHFDQPITPSALAALATDKRGLLKGIPPNASAVLVLTDVDKHSRRGEKEVARLAMASGHYSAVILCTQKWAASYLIA